MIALAMCFIVVTGIAFLPIGLAMERGIAN